MRLFFDFIGFSISQNISSQIINYAYLDFIWHSKKFFGKLRSKVSTQMVTGTPFSFSIHGGSSFHGITGRLEQNLQLAHHLLHIGSGGGSPTGQKAQKVSGDSHPARLRGIAGRGLLGQFPFQASADSGLLQRESRQTGKENFRVTKETSSLGICTGTKSSRLSKKWCLCTHH